MYVESVMNKYICILFNSVVKLYTFLVSTLIVLLEWLGLFINLEQKVKPQIPYEVSLVFIFTLLQHKCNHICNHIIIILCNNLTICTIYNALASKKSTYIL